MTEIRDQRDQRYSNDWMYVNRMFCLISLLLATGFAGAFPSTAPFLRTTPRTMDISRSMLDMILLDDTPTIYPPNQKSTPISFPAQYALDVGCGIGDSTSILRYLLPEDFNVVGIDNDPRMIMKARQRHHYNDILFMEADALKTPFSDETFDIIQIKNTMLYIYNHDHLIHELFRILKRDGCIMVIDYNHDHKYMKELETMDWRLRQKYGIYWISHPEHYHNRFGSYFRKVYPTISRDGKSFSLFYKPSL